MCIRVWFRIEFIPHPHSLSILTDKHICVCLHFGSTERYKAEFDLCDYTLPRSSFFWFGHSQWLYYPAEVKVPSDYDWKFVLLMRGKRGYPKTQCLDVQYFSISINYRVKRGEKIGRNRRLGRSSISAVQDYFIYIPHLHFHYSPIFYLSQPLAVSFCCTFVSHSMHPSKLPSRPFNKHRNFLPNPTQ